jgi:hypothetical protein
MKQLTILAVLVFTARLLPAQDETRIQLKTQFSKYQRNVIQEKLFVHTDKTFYIAGETVWFAVYSLDASIHRPFDMSKIAYIELLNKDHKRVFQTKVALNRANGNGSFRLPTSIGSGNYIFLAYTSWMKNFSPDFYYQQNLQIVNTLKLTAMTQTHKIPWSIQFFPEGGTCIAGYPANFAFKAVDSFGRSLDCKGVVITQHKDTVSHFESLHNGMGTFQLTMEKNMAYYACVTQNGELIKQQLPVAADQGLMMNASTSIGDSIRVHVQGSSDFNNTTIYLLTQSNQMTEEAQSNILRNGECIFTVDKKNLADGISTLTIFDQLRKPVCERLAFKRPADTAHLMIRADQTVYQKRKIVNLELTPVAVNPATLNGNFSLSVYLTDSLQGLPKENVVTWLYLSSELKGRIESPDYYFTHPDSKTDKALDNLLLTQGWRKFKESEELNDNKPSFEFLPELEGAVVNGRIVDKVTGAGIAGSGAYLSIPGSPYAFTSSTSNAQGDIRFGFPDVYNNKVLVLQTALNRDSNYRIEITNAYTDKFPSITAPPFFLSPLSEKQLLNRSIGNQVENTYAAQRKNHFIYPLTDSTSFYGKPDKLYNLEDFTRFQTMDEVMREYVNDVRVRKEGDRYNFKVRNDLFNVYFEEDPLILLDGVPVSDATRIIMLDPAKVKTIEVISRNYCTGSSTFQGIVSLTSYSGELGATVINPNALVVEYEGLQQQRTFYSPQYTTTRDTENHLPDFRNVLYWNPQVKLDANGKMHLSFYSSDMKGRFIAFVQGMFNNGLPAMGVTTFEVKDSEQ